MNKPLSRRGFLKLMGGSILGLTFLPQIQQVLATKTPQDSIWVNDMHTQLNPTKVNEIVQLQTLPESITHIQAFRPSQTGIAIAGARLSAGGQQFLKNGLLFDNRKLNQIIAYDPITQTIEVESGCTWPQIMNALHQRGSDHTIRQKPTGNDEITIGGSLSTNIHGRGLNFPPIISDIESIQLINANGELILCSRRQNQELFSLAIGGYGLFGFIYSACIRLYPRQKVQRKVTPMALSEVPDYYQQAVGAGCLYGDYEFSMDENSESYMRDGFFVSYQPVEKDTPITSEVPDTELAQHNLSYLVHVDKAKAYSIYKNHRLNTEGQVFWNDDQQLGNYVNNYHRYIDQQLHNKTQATEAIMEVFIPLKALTQLFELVRQDFLKHQVNLIYGTIRFIQKDSDSFMPWAKNDFACVIFNIHTPHNASGLQKTKRAIQQLIQTVSQYEGTYYLTYENYATQAQVEQCYPEMKAFLSKKLAFDPGEVFQNNWYRHHKRLLS